LAVVKSLIKDGSFSEERDTLTAFHQRSHLGLIERARKLFDLYTGGSKRFQRFL
jgi:hypothetical protein